MITVAMPYNIMIGKDKIITTEYESPCGRLVLGSFGDKLCFCEWQTGKRDGRIRDRLRRMLHAEFEPGTSAILDKAVSFLDEYFEGRGHESNLPLLFVGTDFQRKVWDTLLTIPYGTTISYGEMARQIGMPKAVRALANANGANAISIFAPCHRVIGSDHSLTGYGGGLAAKEFLLTLEGVSKPSPGYVSDRS